MGKILRSLCRRHPLKSSCGTCICFYIAYFGWCYSVIVAFLGGRLPSRHAASPPPQHQDRPAHVVAPPASVCAATPHGTVREWRPHGHADVSQRRALSIVADVLLPAVGPRRGKLHRRSLRAWGSGRELCLKLLKDVVVELLELVRLSLLHPFHLKSPKHHSRQSASESPSAPAGAALRCARGARLRHVVREHVLDAAL